jgi:hypothetical protein
MFQHRDFTSAPEEIVKHHGRGNKIDKQKKKKFMEDFGFE